MRILTNKRVKWGKSRDVDYFKGSLLGYPKSIEVRYRQEMEKLIERMRADYRKELEGLTKSISLALDGVTLDESINGKARRILNALRDKWQSIFNQKSNSMASKFIDEVEMDSKKRLELSLEALAGAKVIDVAKMPLDLKDKVQASIYANVDLIKSIPRQYHERIRGSVTRSIQSGGANIILREVEAIGRSTKKRANLIAVDQTRKITSQMNTERMKGAGITQVEWRHSGAGKEPRPLHQDYDGRIFDLNDPPIIDERTGQRGWGGFLVNCRCTVLPIVDFKKYLKEND